MFGSRSDDTSAKGIWAAAGRFMFGLVASSWFWDMSSDWTGAHICMWGWIWGCMLFISSWLWSRAAWPCVWGRISVFSDKPCSPMSPCGPLLVCSEDTWKIPITGLTTVKTMFPCASRPSILVEGSMFYLLVWEGRPWFTLGGPCSSAVTVRGSNLGGGGTKISHVRKILLLLLTILSQWMAST